MADSQIESFGKIGILVNNVPINIPHWVADVTEDVLDREMKTNLKGLFPAVRAKGRS